MQPYIRSWQVFRCPSAPNIPYGAAEEPVGNSDTSYAVNQVVTGFSFSKIPDAAGIVWAQEMTYASNRAIARPRINSIYYDLWACYVDGSAASGLDTSNRHFGGGNLLFCDGHVKFRQASTLRASEFGLTGGLTVNGDASDTPGLSEARSYRAAF